MFNAPFIKNEKYDEVLPQIAKSVSFALHKKDDDFLLVIVGTTGTGKTSLMFHIMELFLGGESSVDYLGLNRSDFAKALKRAKDKKLPRFCCNDEANIQKRDSMTKYNKAIIDLYMSIRGLRIFHVWCNPSIDAIDKSFIEERIKGLIYVATKDIDRPRLYYYFRKSDLLKIWEKYKTLKLPLLHKLRRSDAYYRGWFWKYEGNLWEQYLEKKECRMDDKVDDFFDKYGKKDNMFSSREIKKKLGISPLTLHKYRTEMIKNGELTKDDFMITATGYYHYNENAIKKFEERAKQNRKNTNDSLRRKQKQNDKQKS